MSGSYWIGDIVFGGVPIAPVKRDLGKLIVPDLSQKLIYALTDNHLVAHRLDVALTDIGLRDATYPVPEKKLHEVFQHLYRMRD